MAELVRVAALTGYLETMAGFDIDPRLLLKEQGLGANSLANPEHLIPAKSAIRLLERSAQEANCQTLGLRMAQGRALANLGAASLLIAHQPTLRSALAALAEFRSRINSTLVMHIEEFDGGAIIREDFVLSRPEPSRQASNLAVGVLTRMCGTILGNRWSPRTVYFSHAAPSVEDLQLFSSLFGCRPLFDRDFNGIVVSTEDLDRPNAKADDQLAIHARHLLESVMSPVRRTIKEEVDKLIRFLLPTGTANIQTCAASLGLTVRTLQRSLDAENENFSDLLHRARMQLATEYLTNPRIRITDVADMLGYGSIGAFTRWHTQAFGQSPRVKRKTAQAHLASRQPVDGS